MSENMESPTPTPRPAQGEWKLPFLTIWGGHIVSLFGSQVVQFSLVWWLTRSTGSATVLATATLLALLPQILLSPLAGALVDRWNRRLLMMASDAVVALATLVLISLFARGAAQVWHVYAIMMIRSACGVFHRPSLQASIPLLVPEQHLARIAGFNQMLLGAITIIAPPLGALLLEVLPIAGVLAIDPATAILAVVPLIFIDIPRPARSGVSDLAGPGPSIWQDITAGARYLMRWRGLLIVLLMAASLNFLLHPALALLPILVTVEFGGDALRLGWIESTWGIGVVLGGLTLGMWGGFARKLATSLSGLICMGVAEVVLGASPASGFAVALGAMFVVGFMNPLVNGPTTALLQSVVAKDMQGRIFTLAGALASVMAPLGLAIAGPVADALGARIWYVAAGGLCVLMGVVGFFVPSLMNIESEQRGEPASAGSEAPARPKGEPSE